MESNIGQPTTTITSDSIRVLNERIQQASAFVDLIDQEMGRVIVGQKDMVQKLLVALLADGHVLLEGVPGLAKTMAIKALARTVDVGFSRIQFTPDLLPADLIGTMIYSQRNEEFTVKKGPVFSNFILADEINRAPAKVQSALLEAMQERQVTLGAQTYPLPQPFLVLATMNPIEQEGTYPLPEAQTDRFMLKVVLDYPLKEEEKLIIRQNVRPGGMANTNTVVSANEILTARQAGPRGIHGREDRAVHRGHRLCHTQAGPIQALGPQFHDLLRRKSPGEHQYGVGRQGAGLHQTQGLCDPRGCAVGMS
jgi:MoxR-like ATPase